MGKLKRKYIRFLPLFLMTIPGMAYLIINNYLPMAGILLAFRKVNFAGGITGGEWVGLQNFEFLLKSQNTWQIIRNTIGYNILFIILGTICAVLLAIILNEAASKIAIGVGQTVTLLPQMISMVLVSYIVQGFLQPDYGLLNSQVLPALGLEPVNWYWTESVWPVILPIVYLWKNIGFQSIIYFAAVRGIDPGLYEAASIDGAGKWKQIWYITLPGLKQIIVVMTILAVGRILNSDFGLFYQVPMNSSAIYETTNTIETFTYRALTQVFDIGMASVTSFVQSVVGFVLIIVANLVIRKVSPEDAFF